MYDLWEFDKMNLVKLMVLFYLSLDDFNLIENKN